MKCIVGLMLVLLLATPALPGQVKPGDEKEPASPRERYEALRKDFAVQQRQIIMAAQKAKGAEQNKLVEKYRRLGSDFAEKFYKLAEDNPQDAVAVDALFWVLQNGPGSAVYSKATAKVTDLVEKMPLTDLARRLNTLRGTNTQLLEAVLRRAEKDETNPHAADLLAWVATSGSFSPMGKQAIDRLIARYPDHVAIERICQVLGRSFSPGAADVLERILDKTSNPGVKAAAALGLGKNLAAQSDRLGDQLAKAEKVAAKAEKYLAMAVELLAKNNPTQQAEAERELKTFRRLRVGKVAPEISGTDLDTKSFKLSDYRGKVVLLDFWGNW